MKRFNLTIAAVFAYGVTQAHESENLSDMMQSFGTDLDSATVRTEKIATGLHVLYGAGGNVVVSIGEQGVLMVDSQFPQMIPKLKTAIRELGGGEIDFTINTHWHYDHADGNPLLGREGSWLISQLNSRQMMISDRTIDYGDKFYIQPAYPSEGLPVLTFSDQMQIFFNDQRIDIMHFGPAHTTGDAVVYFRNDNVIHMGDVFFARYPYIDTAHGGDLDGMISFCRSVLESIDRNTKLVPGHGPVLSYPDLENYIDMLTTVRMRVSALIDDGKSLTEVIDSKPTADFDKQFGNPRLLLNATYHSLSN